MAYDIKTRLAVRSMINLGYSDRKIAYVLEIPRRTVNDLRNGRSGGKQQQVADRLEHFAKGGGSGCYVNGVEMLTEEAMSHGDPLEELIAMETIEEKYNGR